MHAKELREQSVKERELNRQLATKVLETKWAEIKEFADQAVLSSLEEGDITTRFDIRSLVEEEINKVINESNVKNTARRYNGVLRSVAVGVKLFINTEEGGYPGCGVSRDDVTTIIINWGGGVIKPLT